MNEMVVESRQRVTSDHTTTELIYLKAQLQQTSSQLSDAQHMLAVKVSKKTAASICNYNLCMYAFTIFPAKLRFGAVHK